VPYKDPERQRAAVRAYQRDHPDKRGPSHGAKRFLAGPMVAVDGEGISVGTDAQAYALLADSRGRSIWDERGLTTRECLEFLLGIPALYGKGPVVAYAMNYDVEAWLSGLSPSKMGRLFRWKSVLWGPYRVRWVPGKWFEVWRLEGERAYVRVDDLFSNFHGSFESTAFAWLGEKNPVVSEGKAKRGSYTAADQDYLTRYNAAELEMMERLALRFREAREQVGVRSPYYYSPAVLGKAFLRAHGVAKLVAKANEVAPPEVHAASSGAFFGGRIELAGFGRHLGTVYEADLNSAYPAVLCEVPDLSAGRWIQVKEIDYSRDTALYRIRWDYRKVPRRFYPFPWRKPRTGAVFFPRCGTGWVWGPEILAAMGVGELEVSVLDGWAFDPDRPNDRPFSWVSDLYAKRLALGLSPAANVLKLGLNSIYGAFAQQLSLGRDTVPTYRQMAYAGLITSLTRAHLYRLLRQNEDSVISLATDGIYSLAPITEGPHLGESSTVLGRLKQKRHREIVSLQSGVYRLTTEAGEFVSHARGYRGTEIPWERILEGWNAGESKVQYLTRERFIGTRQALALGHAGDRRAWRKQRRTIQLRDAGKKRAAVRVDTNPAEGLIWTLPEMSGFTPWSESAPYTGKGPRDDSIEVGESLTEAELIGESAET
jgi:hypothetical protein